MNAPGMVRDFQDQSEKSSISFDNRSSRNYRFTPYAQTTVMLSGNTSVIDKDQTNKMIVVRSTSN